MNLAREKPYVFRQPLPPLPPLPPPKRRRYATPARRVEDYGGGGGGGGEEWTSHNPPPATVLVIGLPPDCSILDLKSRFEVYGRISRIRFEHDALCYVTFRSNPDADAAIAASLDPSFGVALFSKTVKVLRANDSVPNRARGSHSRLLSAGVPLSRHGKGNKLRPVGGGGNSGIDGREIIDYSDLWG